ncbi:hypothetical protein ACFY04_43635 [Streptomyces sp. NPDC001549]|uniref:hypothetical protein n=1 Tax=Streptomyces sp. NPDC001549 TaxID=3364586 RepID=UPI00369E8383
MVIGRLARTARALAVEAGQAVSEPVLHEVEQIRDAVLADADVAEQWAAIFATGMPCADSSTIWAPVRSPPTRYPGE